MNIEISKWIKQADHDLQMAKAAQALAWAKGQLNA